jgi:NRPS condensation-like uncharacterized protein
MWKWVPAGNDHDFILWTENDTTLAPMMPFDIRVRPGVLLTVAQTATYTDMLFQFHHSCCDGRDSFSFIGDVLEMYVTLLDSNSDKTFRECPAEEQDNGKQNGFVLTWQNLHRTTQRIGILIKDMLVFFARSPISLIPAGQTFLDNSKHVDHLARSSTSFDAVETESLNTAARLRGVRMNDLLMRDIFLAIGEWKQRHAPVNSQDWLRFCIPVDIRRHKEFCNFMGNGASYTFIDRRLCDLHNPVDLLSSIHGDMELVKSKQLDLQFIKGLKILGKFPGARQWVLAQKKCQSTCVVTNLGRVLNRHRLPRREGRIVLGDVELEEIEILAPLRPFTSAAFAIHFYARRLAITLHYDSRILSKHQADDLMAMFTHFLRLSMEQTIVSSSSDI